MKIVMASDHAGFGYKTILLAYLKEQGFAVTDLGAFDAAVATDYPDHAADVAKAIQLQQAERGIIICGSGVGVCVAANKFKGIRAGVCHDNYSAHQCVEHDDVNVLCMGERVIGIEPAKEIAVTFLQAVFSHAERHQRRLDKINNLEANNMK